MVKFLENRDNNIQEVIVPSKGETYNATGFENLTSSRHIPYRGMGLWQLFAQATVVACGILYT